MEAYKPNTLGYEVFNINMTVDTRTELYFRGTALCKACQCNCLKCFACRTGIINNGLEEVSQNEAETVLKTLLVA